MGSEEELEGKSCAGTSREGRKLIKEERLTNIEARACFKWTAK